MLIVGTTLRNMPILSLQTGSRIAHTEVEIIDPSKLKIVAFYVKGETLDFSPAILLTADIREIGKLGAIVNASDDFVRPGDLVTMKDVIDLHFDLEGMNVVDTNDEKLGRVARYTVDISSFIIQQLQIRRPLLKSFSEAELIVDRSQIVSITDTQITVQAPEIKETKQHPAHIVANTFRSPQPKAEASKTN